MFEQTPNKMLPNLHDNVSREFANDFLCGNFVTRFFWTVKEINSTFRPPTNTNPGSDGGGNVCGVDVSIDALLDVFAAIEQL